MQFQLQIQAGAASGQRRQVAIDAASEAEAVRIAARKGWRVLSIDLPAAQGAASAPRRKLAFPLMQFSQELLALLEAGLNLTEAIATLHNKESAGPTRITIVAIFATLE